MPIATNPDWLQVALIALGAFVLFFLLFRIPYVVRVLRAVVTLGLAVLAVILLLQQAPYDPNLARFIAWLGLDDQQVNGGSEVRIPMARDGHFWARVSLNGVERRMLVDSGATLT